MDSLDSIGREQVDPKVVKLTHQRNSLEKEIDAKKKELEELGKTKIDTGEARNTLFKLAGKVKAAQVELSKTFTDKEGVLIAFDKAKDLRESYNRSLESDIKKNEAKIEKQEDKITENENRFKSNSVEFKKLLSIEKEAEEGKAADSMGKLAAKIDKLRVEKRSTLDSNAVLSAEQKILKNSNKKLTDDRKGLEVDIEGLLSDKEQFNTLNPELRQLRKEISIAEVRLEKLLEFNTGEDLRMKELTADQEVKIKWMTEKEVRLGKIINALSKKTDDPAILRMIDNV